MGGGRSEPAPHCVVHWAFRMGHAACRGRRKWGAERPPRRHGPFSASGSVVSGTQIGACHRSGLSPIWPVTDLARSAVPICRHRSAEFPQNPPCVAQSHPTDARRPACVADQWLISGSNPDWPSIGPDWPGKKAEERGRGCLISGSDPDCLRLPFRLPLVPSLDPNPAAGSMLWSR
jgi:hypothetical protein